MVNLVGVEDSTKM